MLTALLTIGLIFTSIICVLTIILHVKTRKSHNYTESGLRDLIKITIDEKKELEDKLISIHSIALDFQNES